MAEQHALASDANRDATVLSEAAAALDPHLQPVVNQPLDAQRSQQEQEQEHDVQQHETRALAAAAAPYSASSSSPSEEEEEEERREEQEEVEKDVLPIKGASKSRPVAMDRIRTASTGLSRVTTGELSDPDTGAADDADNDNDNSRGGLRKKAKKPWYKRLNPLKWGKRPPVPTERQVCPEKDAGFFSQLVFAWMGPLMSTGYRRTLEPNDVWLVNPDRSMDAVATRLARSFERRRRRGDRHPLLWAMHETCRSEFWLGGACSLLASVLQVVAPFTLRFLIAFAQEAYYAAAGDGQQGPPLGNGLGLVFGVTIMQILQSMATTHFIYRGFIVGAQIRAALIVLIFEKALRLSPRAKAGGKALESEASGGGGSGGRDGSSSSNSDAGSEEATRLKEREELRKAKDGLIARILDKKASAKKGPPPPSSPAPAKAGVSGDGTGWSNGRIVNLMSTDTYRIYEASGLFHMIWSSPTAALITLALLLVNLTYSALAGFAFIALGMPLLTKAIKKLLYRRRAISRITDQRVSLTQEVLQAVRFVKYFGWEESFLERINQIRKREIRGIQILLGLRNAVLAVSMSMPVFASMLSFITFSLSNHALNPAPVFSSLALFNALRMPLNMLPMVIGQVTDAWASLGRIQEFLLAEEQHDEIVWDMQAKDAIVIRDASFTWERTSTQDQQTVDPKKAPGQNKPGAMTSDRRSTGVDAGTGTGTGTPASPTGDRFSKRFSWMSTSRQPKSPQKPGLDAKIATTTKMEEREPFRLKDISFSIGRKELIAVVGTVGSGKTSLLAALAGDMRMTRGAITMGASRAFCPQYAWIQNATVKDNILFGKPMDRRWYNQVVDACALRPDLDILPAGDLTEIGERGITLSGGQKQRLNIARAIYYDADLVLMDDPLSAVDAHVGRHIFDRAICGLLAHKCRILATHQLHVLARCDRIVLMEDGAIRKIDTFENLMAGDEGFRQTMASTAQEHKSEEEEENKKEGEGKDPKADRAAVKQEELDRRKKAKKGAALMQDEERAVKSVSWAVYGAYLRASGSYLNGPLAVFLLALSQCSNIATSLWLSYWTADTFGLQTGQYIGVYAGLGAVQALFMFCYSFGIAIMGTNASRIMLRQAMYRVLRAPMSFFDTTPLGRITNRFSKDVDVMDNTLSDAMRMFTFTLAMIGSVYVLIIVYFPYFAVALGPLLLAFLASAGYYRASAREVKRLEAVKRSFVFARFSEGISGTASIRAYGLQAHFAADMRSVTDDMNSAYYLTFSNQRWLSLRLDAIANLLVFTTGVLVVTSRFNVSPSISGLVLSYILSIVQMMQFSIRQLAEVENAMNSTERVHYYGTQLEEEAPRHLPPGAGGAAVTEEWPQAGAIEFRDVQMRYRAGLPLVLRDVNIDIQGGERVGIVGRTGAGKSSITSALFRLVELSGGRICIDGVDIARVGLQDLRSRLAIIPQDPTLFRGTVRSNLDPFGKHSDLELWSALRQAGLVDADRPIVDPGEPQQQRYQQKEDPAENAAEKNPTTVVATTTGGGGSSSGGQRIHLDGAVEDEGLNFSLGQRQMMALARALVRDCRVIVCDEATSSVDVDTDARIQRTMATAFRGRTLLCIAHRLRTILSYDRVVVMDQGRIVEMDAPLTLWERGGGGGGGGEGMFRAMCDRSGIRREDFFEHEREREHG